jgi:methanogenic corrinoid protein MtbC1
MALKEDFISLLERKDKAGCIEVVTSALSSGQIDVVTVYNDVLRQALIEDFCKEEEGGSYCIWEEHIRTSIVRTVIENCYPYVIKERKERYGAANGEKVLVVCPTEEFHEIGARMVADFFDLCGYDVTFVGANTPQDELIEAIVHIKPVYVAISVTNYYNLVAAKRTIEKVRNLRKKHKDLKFKILVGGNAFETNANAAKDMKADIMLRNFDDIRRLSEGGG